MTPLVGHAKRCGFKPRRDDETLERAKEAIRSAFPSWYRRTTGDTWTEYGMAGAIELDAERRKHQP